MEVTSGRAAAPKLQLEPGTVGERLGDALRLDVLRRAEVMDTPAERAFDRWCTLAMRLTGGDGAFVTFLDEEREFFKCISGLPSKPQRRGLAFSHSIGQYVVALAEPLWISDARADPLLHANGAVVELGVVGYAGAPIVAGGVVVGTLAVTSESPRTWSEDARMVIRELADAVSNEITLRIVAGDLRRAKEELLARQTLITSHDRAREMVATGEDLPSVLGELVRIIERHDPSVRGSVMLLQPDGTLRTGAAPNVAQEYLSAIERIPVGPEIGTCGAAAFLGKPVFTDDTSKDPRWVPFAALAAAHHLAHCWSIPVLASDGPVLGTFALYGATPREPDESLLEVVRHAAHVAAIAIERERASARLRYEATHDTTTGLWNRARILDRLREDLAGTGGPIALLLIDLDRLGLFNDSLGHDLGDDVVAETARRIAAVTAPPRAAAVGRLGGDEFAVLLGDATAARAVSLGEAILKAVAQPLVEGALAGLTTTASAGIVVVHPGADPREALRHADSAMRDAKRAGGHRVRLYEERMRSTAGRVLQLGSELRHALRRDELEVVFQPLVELADDEIIGAEALLRWHHPSLGSISPAEFIPVAEETGQIVEIVDWVLERACTAVRSLATRSGAPVRLAVNASALQIEDPELPVRVAAVLARTGVAAGDLALEITETALLHADVRVGETLAALKALGVSIVLDDFGTGFSSLALLKRHPVDAIKIDRHFVSGLPDDPDDTAIVTAVISMARSLSLSVTAEGVETAAQLAAVRALGANHAQGYLLGRPGTVDALAGGQRVVPGLSVRARPGARGQGAQLSQ